MLAILVEAIRIDPDWANCVVGINGAYDPPKALTPEGAIATHTSPGRITQTTSEAVPASSPKPTLATTTPTADLNKAPDPATTSETHRSPHNLHGSVSPTAAEADEGSDA
jgi:hypothetical protein